MRTLTSRIGTVNEVSRFMKMSAARNSFHELMNANSATVTIAGHGERQEDAGEALPGRAAVNHRRLLDFARDGFETVAHQEDRERQLQDRMHDREAEVRVDEADLGEVEIERGQKRLIGDHDRREQDEKGDLFAAHGEAREPVARRRREREAGRNGHQPRPARSCRHRSQGPPENWKTLA